LDPIWLSPSALHCLHQVDPVTRAALSANCTTIVVPLRHQWFRWSVGQVSDSHHTELKYSNTGIPSGPHTCRIFSFAGIVFIFTDQLVGFVFVSLLGWKVNTSGIEKCLGRRT